jgi:hypothetical protein
MAYWWFCDKVTPLQEWPLTNVCSHVPIAARGLTANWAPKQQGLNDVDVFLVMEDTFDATHLTGEAQLLFDHAVAQASFGGSVFWLRRLAALGGEQSAIADWQITRNGSRRGIIEIVLEVP